MAERFFPQITARSTEAGDEVIDLDELNVRSTVSFAVGLRKNPDALLTGSVTLDNVPNFSQTQPFKMGTNNGFHRRFILNTP